MAIQRSDKIKAAVFLIVSAVLFGGLVISLVGMQWLKKTDRYYIEFKESVKGLSPGSPVRYHGVTVGKVKSIDYELTARVARVVAEVAPNTPIKLDSYATLGTESLIIGNKFIQIDPGTVGADLMPPNDQDYVIKGRQSQFEQFQEHVINITASVGELINNMNRTFSPENRLVISSILTQIDLVLTSNSTAFTAALLQLQSTLVRMDQAIGSVNRLILDNHQFITETMLNLRTASDSMNELLDKVNRQPSILIRGGEVPRERWMDK